MLALANRPTLVYWLTSGRATIPWLSNRQEVNPVFYSYEENDERKDNLKVLLLSTSACLV